MKCNLESFIDLIHEKKDLIRGNFGNEIFIWNVTNVIATFGWDVDIIEKVWVN